MRTRTIKRQARGCLLATLAALALTAPAHAADYDILRGPEMAPPAPAPVPVPVHTVGPATFTRWSGFYFGGQGSFNYGRADFSTTTQPLVALALQDTAVQSEFQPSQLQALSGGSQSAFGFGGFLGYNSQWQDLIIGVEADYTRTSLLMASSSPTVIARSFDPPVGNVTSVTIQNASAQMTLTDYAEARARAGYILGNALPYGFVGLVVGRGSYNASIEVGATCGDFNLECTGYPLLPTSGQSTAYLYGWSAGGGLDWALTPNFFLRAEAEFIQFGPFANTALMMLNARVGGGFKF
jgi:outer membrane immunogenic protein